MPDYVLNRNYVLRTTKGHTISFVKGQPVYVPPVIEKDAIAIGAERSDGGATDPLGEEVVQQPPLNGDELKLLMFSAFEEIAAKNDANDFTGQGVPTVKAVERIIGTDVSRTDLVAAWAEFKIKAE